MVFRVPCHPPDVADGQEMSSEQQSAGTGPPGISEFLILGPQTLIPGAATQAGLPLSSGTARNLFPPASA